MPTKPVTLLSSLKSQHLEGSELDDRGSPAVGEFVCAARSISGVQEKYFGIAGPQEQSLGLSQQQITLESFFKLG